MQILLADDNNEIRAALRLLLEEFGESDILEAADQAQVLAAVERNSVDIVLLDWELPQSSAGSRCSSERLWDGDPCRGVEAQGHRLQDHRYERETRGQRVVLAWRM
jgi:CheY-like chemotaxis protein